MLAGISQGQETSHPGLLVGLETRDDAGVIRLTDDSALVLTADFITPVVDCAHDFGRIAASNALSDVYAMGAEPLAAINLVAFPVGRLPAETLGQILAGGGATLARAGVTLLGGHSIDDPEPKFGLAVAGLVSPSKVVRNSTARPGDLLILTKPIGAGVLTTAGKQDRARPEHLARAVEVMAGLNDGAMRAMTRVGVSAATDVTGFGLLGHAFEMAESSGLCFNLRCKDVPLLPGALEAALDGAVPGGTRGNLAWLEERGALACAEGIGETERLLLADAMTSGGLLISCPARLVDELMEQLSRQGVAGASVVGQTSERRAPGPFLWVS